MNSKQKSLILNLLGKAQTETLEDMQMLIDSGMAQDDLYKSESNNLDLIHSTFSIIIRVVTQEETK